MNIIKHAICVVLLLTLGVGITWAAADGDSEKKTVWSSIDLQFYGFVKVDAASDTGHANPGNFVKWVDLEPLNQDDSQFSLTANQTRLGLWLTSPDDPDKSLLTKGRVEIDFYGGGAENKPNPMLRLAYIDLHWRKSGWRFVAGQTFDVISPLFPSTINYSVQWWAGNVGYRRPQLRLSKDLAFTESSKLLLTGAITRNMGSTDSAFADVDTGTDAGIPGLQGRLGWQMGKRQAGPVAVGISGHWAEEEFELDDAGNTERFDSWSANFDLKVPLTDKVMLQGEAYTGTNLAQYLGGIGQGVNIERGQEIGDTGGWISLDLGPYNRLAHHVGLTATDVDDDNLDPGQRSFNSSIFWNGVYSLTEHVRFALELSYWKTEYKVPDAVQDSADSFRTQFAVIYRF
jgi:hypothetical protein